MKQIISLQNTLILLSTALLLISFNARSATASEKISACNAALNQADVNGALRISEEILKQQSNNRDGLLCMAGRWGRRASMKMR